MKRRLSLILALSAISCFAQAGELVTNGGFETGDFTGWIAGTTGGIIQTSTFAHTGKYSAELYAPNVTGDSTFLSQTITETPLSQISSFDVWIATEGADLTVNIEDGLGGLYQYDKVIGNTNRGWTEWNILPTISGGSLTQISSIEFELNDFSGVTNSVVRLDDISIKTQAVPEPSALLVLAPGVLLFSRRRNRR